MDLKERVIAIDKIAELSHSINMIKDIVNLDRNPEEKAKYIIYEFLKSLFPDDKGYDLSIKIKTIEHMDIIIHKFWVGLNEQKDHQKQEKLDDIEIGILKAKIEKLEIELKLLKQFIYPESKSE